MQMSDPTSINTATVESEPLLDQHDGEQRKSTKIQEVGTNGQLWTLIVIFKAYIGAGIMGLPSAFNKGHFIASNIGYETLGKKKKKKKKKKSVWFVAALSLFCIKMLMAVHESLPPGQITSLEEIGCEVFGGHKKRMGRASLIAVKVIVAYTQIGFSTVRAANRATKTQHSLFSTGIRDFHCAKRVRHGSNWLALVCVGSNAATVRNHKPQTNGKVEFHLIVGISVIVNIMYSIDGLLFGKKKKKKKKKK